jgi:hypothetical protein
VISRRELLGGAVALALATGDQSARGAFWSGQASSNPVQTGWAQLPVGGGGFARSLSVNPTDGTMLLRTDSAGAWIWNGSQWVTAIANMPASLFTTANVWLPGTGVYEIVSAPSNSQIVYMAYQTTVYKSTNKCASWSATGFSGSSGLFPANTAFDCVGPRIAVDPQNANIAYVGTPSNGVWYTTNGGTSWTQIASGSVPFSGTVPSGPAAGGYPGHTIWFDAASAVVGGATQGIYISSFGNGLYHSSNGGASWSAVASAPTTICRPQMVGANYYCISAPTWDGLTFAASNISSYISGSWTTLYTEAANDLQAFAVDPNNVNRMVWLNGSGGDTWVSFDGGSTWTENTSVGIAGSITWQNYNPGTGDGWISVGGCFFDPRTANTLAVNHGTGISTLPVPTSGGWPGGLAQYTLNQEGEESLVGNKLLCFPNNKGIVLRSDDFPILVSDGVHYPPQYFPPGTAAFNNGFGIQIEDVDYASDLSGTVITQLGGESIVSTNWGSTWSPMPNIPASGPGGCAASSSTNWIYGEYGTGLWGTNNAGATWTPISIAGADWSGYETLTLVADRVTPNTYYLYLAINSSRSNAGVYQITYSGGVWSGTQVYSGIIGGSGTSVFQSPGILRAVPGQAGHLFWGGLGSSPSLVGDTSVIFAFSENGGTTWTTLPGVCAVEGFGFGPPAAGQSYNSIYAVGWDAATQSVFGLYRCVNFNPSNPSTATWTLLGNSNANFAPAGNLVAFGWLDADPTNYGYVYMSSQGQGYLKGYFP